MAAISQASKTGTNDDNVIFGANQSEAERLDLQHRVIHNANPKLVMAPVDLSKPGMRILDQATGSGIWIRDVRATVEAKHTWIGTDIEVSYFPTDPPADTSYHNQSMTKPWPAEWLDSFDLVHSRMALPGVGTNPLKEVVQNLIDLVKPGGWIQFVEMEWVGWDEGPEGKIFHTAVQELFTIVSGGQGVHLREKLGSILNEVGMEDVGSTIFDVPYGAAASDEIRPVSEASLYATAMSVKMSTRMLPAMSTPREQLDALPEIVIAEVKDRGINMKMFGIWARKPIPA